jgi:hypothetical protein
MKNSILITVVFTVFMLSANNLKAQKTNKPGSGIINIKVPDFADPAINKYYHDYAANTIEYVKAIRQKNDAKINTAMDKDIQFYIQSDQISEKVQPTPAELQKAMDFAKQLQPYQEEIINSGYYKEEGRRLRKMPGTNN